MDTTLPPRTGPSLAVAWLAVTLIPAHNVLQRSNAEAVNRLGVEPLVEIGYFGLCGLLALAVLRAVEGRALRARPPVPLLALPAWFLLSSLWSATGPYAVARSAQMAVIATLGWATLAVGRVDPVAIRQLIATFVTWFVRTTVALALAGIVFGPVLVPASEENRERFTWIGAHPNGSGLVMAMALVLLAAAPRTILPMTPTVRAVVVLSLALLLVDNQSRTAWVCLIVGLVALFVLGAVRRPRLRLWSVPLAAGVFGVVVLSFGPLTDYALRDQRASSLATGNGRLGLWPIAFDALTTPFDWIAGLGYGAARTVFVSEEAWARTAHSSVLSALVSGGLIAVALLVVLLWSLARGALRASFLRSSPLAPTCCALATVVVTNGLATDILAEPNIGFSVVCLVVAVVRADAVQPPLAQGASPARCRAVRATASL